MRLPGPFHSEMLLAGVDSQLILSGLVAVSVVCDAMPEPVIIAFVNSLINC